MTASIGSSCPAGSAYIYYGVQTGAFNGAGSYNGNPYSAFSGSACVVGVPSPIYLSGAGNLGLSQITLTLGGNAQTLATYAPNGAKRTVGIAIPDGSIIVAHAESSPANAFAVGHATFSSTGSYQGYLPYVDVNGAPCTLSVGTYYGCANYLFGY